MKKLLTVVALFSALIYGFATPSVLMAAVNELSTSIILSADPMPGGVPVLNVRPSTTYTHTISVTNNLASKAPIVKIVLRLPDPFVMVDPVVCPPNWTEISTQNNGRGVGMINCVENGLDTSISNPTSNPQYDLAYGQTTNVSYSFTSPSVNGTTDLALQVFYINSNGLMQGTGFTGTYAPAQIVVKPVSPSVDNVVINRGLPINANANHGSYPYNPTNETAVPVTGHVTDANKVTISAGTLAVDVTPDVNGNFSTSLNFFSVGDGDVLFTITPKDTVTQTSGTPFVKTVLKDTWIPRIVAITSNATTPGVLTIGDTIEFILSVQDVPVPDIAQKIIGSYNSRPLSWSQIGTNGSYSIWKATYTVQAGDHGNSTPLQITGVHAIDGAGNESDPRLSSGGFDGVDSGTDIQKTISVVDITAPFIFDLSVSSITPTSATISWTTNEVADGEVYIGTNNPVKSGIFRKVENKTLSTAHSFTLTGLNASTTYFYVVESRDASRNKVKSNQQSFVTPMEM